MATMARVLKLAWTTCKACLVFAPSHSTMSEIRNLARHLEAVKAGSAVYAKVGIDQATAKLMLDGEPWQSIDEILDDELLEELLK